MAAVTDYQKLHSLQQCKFFFFFFFFLQIYCLIILVFRNPKWASGLRYQQSCFPSRGSREESIPLLCPASRGHHERSLLSPLSPFSIFKSNIRLSSHTSVLCLSPLFPFSTSKNLCDYIGASLVAQMVIILGSFR